MKVARSYPNGHQNVAAHAVLSSGRTLLLQPVGFVLPYVRLKCAREPAEDPTVRIDEPSMTDDADSDG